MGRQGRGIWKVAASLVVLGAAGYGVLISPWTWSALHGARELPPLEGADLKNGREVFVASDCATCHATPGQDKDTVLGGGRVLETQFGTFHMPNVSPHPERGIGKWTLAEFDRALREGVGPGGLDGQNLYPAFPYTSYQRLSGEDVRDLYAYMMTLPVEDDAVPEHQLKFPFNMRRGVGLWRLAFLDGKPWQPGPVPAELSGDMAKAYQRGEYLVEGAGHCAECHSSRGFMGNVLAESRYGGGPDTTGTGWFPNITPDETGIGFWSAALLARYLHTGVSPIGRAADGEMAEVIRNTSQMSAKDIGAMALYLKYLPPVSKLAPRMPTPNYTEEVVMLKDWAQVSARLPVSAASAFEVGKPATVVTSKAVWLDAKDVGQSDSAPGKLLGGAQVTVKAREGDRLQLVLKGWQVEETPSVIYQARGQRVMMAVLDDAAADKVVRGKPEQDADTGQRWMPVTLEVWSDATGMNADRGAVWAYGKDAYQEACSACHVLPQQEHFTANQWVGTLKSMRRFTSFSDDQYRLILSYLQNHSKDLHDDGTSGSGHGGK